MSNVALITKITAIVTPTAIAPVSKLYPLIFMGIGVAESRELLLVEELELEAGVEGKANVVKAEAETPDGPGGKYRTWTQLGAFYKK